MAGRQTLRCASKHARLLGLASNPIPAQPQPNEYRARPYPLMEAVMLHSKSPTTYVPSEKLADTASCPHCGAKITLSGGVIHLGHYKAEGKVREGLIWTCSAKCFLAWEHHSFMAKC
jgi:hypothetical protein